MPVNEALRAYGRAIETCREAESVLSKAYDELLKTPVPIPEDRNIHVHDSYPHSCLGEAVEAARMARIKKDGWPPLTLSLGTRAAYALGGECGHRELPAVYRGLTITW